MIEPTTVITGATGWRKAQAHVVSVGGTDDITHQAGTLKQALARLADK